MNTARLRSARIEDAAACAELVTELGYPTRPDQMQARLRAILTQPLHVTLVAEEHAHTLLGMAGGSLGTYYEKDGLYARLNILVVAARAQRMGLGRALVAAIEEWAVRLGARDLVLTSGNQRQDAHRFYASLGFEATGLRLRKNLE